MKRVVIYDVEQKRPPIINSQLNQIKEAQNKKGSWTVEKRARAVKTIEYASVLSNIAKSIESLKLIDPNVDGLVVKNVIEKISTIVEEMKLEFKKDYWE